MSVQVQENEPACAEIGKSMGNSTPISAQGPFIAFISPTSNELIPMQLLPFMRILRFVYASLSSKKLFLLAVGVCLRTREESGKC
jgi:hypothetical protein